MFSTGESHGQRNLAGYSPWGCKSQKGLSNWACMHAPGGKKCKIKVSAGLISSDGCGCVGIFVPCLSAASGGLLAMWHFLACSISTQSLPSFSHLLRVHVYVQIPPVLVTQLCLFETQGLNPGLLHFRQILYSLSYMDISPLNVNASYKRITSTQFPEHLPCLLFYFILK